MKVLVGSISVANSAEERKQRRLETNRAAAKRSYYRRQVKMAAMKEENERLKHATMAQTERLRIQEMRLRVYEMLLKQLGVEPSAAMAMIMAGRGAAAAAMPVGPMPR